MAQLPFRRREAAGTKLPFNPLYLLLILLACITYIILAVLAGTSESIKHPLAFKAAQIVFVGQVLGFITGAVWLDMSDQATAEECQYLRGKAETIGNLQTAESTFLAFIAMIVSAYTVCYFLAALNFARSARPEEWPISQYIAGITAVAIFFLVFFSVKYSGHVRMTRLLELALEKLPGDRHLIAGLRKAVFRGDQLYEPAGNVFVTLGITATFLGLAVALVLLDIPALFGGNLGDVAPTGSLDTAGGEDVPDLVRRTAIASLRSFVGCMGLALGVSMLGVMTALAAQGLRARGASTSTDELLSDARAAIEKITAAEAAAEAAEAVEAARAAEAAEAAKAKRAKAKAARAKAAKASKSGKKPTQPGGSPAGNGNGQASGAAVVTILPSDGLPGGPALADTAASTGAEADAHAPSEERRP